MVCKHTPPTKMRYVSGIELTILNIKPTHKVIELIIAGVNCRFYEVPSYVCEKTIIWFSQFDFGSLQTLQKWISFLNDKNIYK